jgi:hypothetical protein
LSSSLSLKEEEATERKTGKELAGVDRCWGRQLL